jgi:HTH-type transcriptional regulator/antitoxin HigA
MPFIPKVIKNTAEHAAAMAAMRACLDPKNAVRPGRADEFELITTLIDAYERELNPLGPLNDDEILIGLMDSHGWTQADLARMLGADSRVSEILAGRRHLTKAMIATLHAKGVPLAYLTAGYAARCLSAKPVSPRAHGRSARTVKPRHIKAV